MKSAGFTLLELIVTLMIVGVLAVVAIPRLFDRSTFETRGLFDQSQSLVRYAQKVAVAQRRSVRIDLAPASLQACYCATPVCAACAGALLDPAANAALQISYPSPMLSTAPATGDFSFDGLGRPSLAAALTVTITGDTARSFVVERETGYVHPL